MRRMICLIWVAALAVATMIAMMGVSYAAGKGGEMILYAGETRVNSFQDPKSLNFSVDFRKGISRNIEYTVTLMNEGNPTGFPKRDGIAGQIWWVLPFTDPSHRLSVSLGTGPYATYSTIKCPGGYADEHRLAWLVSADVGYKVTRHFTIHAGWVRVGASNGDTDVPRAGIGFKF